MKVKITGRQEIRYSQVIEMSEPDYVRYKELESAGKHAKIDQEFEDYIDKHDVYDGDDMEDVEIVPFVEKASKAA